MADTGLASESARRRRRGESELVTIDSVHQNIHDGLFYTAGFNDPALAAAASLDVLFRVVGGAHARVSVALGGDGTFEAFSGTDASADGTPVASLNRNFFSANIANSLVFSAPTLNSPGTTIGSPQYIFGGTGGNAIGGDLDTFLEWVLTPGDYLLRLTNDTGQVHRSTVRVDWYERGA